MPDLHDGACVEIQGSARRPYVLKNVGGVYSCSCPAWRHQSLPIERRTCKHLRRLRGDAAEAARVGAALSVSPLAKGAGREPPQVLLAQRWDGAADPAGWWLSEKLDGVRGWWDGTQLLSRQGQRYHAPAWFVAGLPDVPLDGELWAGRKQFARTLGIVRRHDESILWQEIRFLIFDAPAAAGGFEERLEFVQRYVAQYRPPYAREHEHVRCTGRRHLEDELARVTSLGGEGLMLRQPGSGYEAGRSPTLLKVKQFQDAEARVVGHEPGAGRHKGRLGALLVELADGTRFAVGSGLSDAQRQCPPPLGSTITFRYQELTERGVPRFPSFGSLRADAQPLHVQTKGGTPMSVPASTVNRRFEFSEGHSDKFWEIAVQGTEVTVRFGRIGTHGQVHAKSFPDDAAAAKHAEKMIQQKVGKGYRPVA